MEMSREMVAEGHSEVEGSVIELKREQCNAEAAAALRHQCRGVDGTSAVQRRWAHAVHCCSMIMSPGGQRKSTTKGASMIGCSMTLLSTIGHESFNFLLLGN